MGEHAREYRIALGAFAGVVAALRGEALGLLARKAEDRNVLRADALENFDVRAVERAERHGAVHHKLHAAGAARFLSGGGDLLGNVGGGVDALPHGDAEVFHEHDLHPAAHHRVGVHEIGHGAHKADALLGKGIAVRGFAGKNERARRDLRVRIVLEPVVEREDLKGVQELTLVGVDALDLHVDDAVRVARDAKVARDIIAEVLFRRELHLGKLAQRLGIVRIGKKPFELFRLLDPAVADALGDVAREAGVRLQKEAAVRNAVRLIVELLRGDGVKIAQDGVFQNLRMELRHAVHRVAADHGEIRHAHEAAADDGGRLLTVVPAGNGLVKALAPAAVDLLDDLELAGQKSAHERHRPLFERFRHDGVVRVGDRAAGDVPRLLPRETLAVHQKTHQLRHAERGVGVVRVDGDALGQLVPGKMRGAERAQHALQPGADEEIFLLETQLLPGGGVVVGVEKAGDRLGVVVGLLRAGIVSGVEGVEIELLVHRARAPETEIVHRVRAVAENGHVVRRGKNAAVIAQLIHHAAVLLAPVHGAAEADLHGFARHRGLPRVAVREPVVRLLGLAAGADALAEKTVTVAKAHADARHVLRRERIEIARRETAQTAVAETGVALAFEQRVQILAELGENVGGHVTDAELDEIVFKQPPDEKFHREVIDDLFSGGGAAAQRFGAHARAAFADHRRERGIALHARALGKRL